MWSRSRVMILCSSGRQHSAESRTDAERMLSFRDGSMQQRKADKAYRCEAHRRLGSERVAMSIRARRVNSHLEKTLEECAKLTSSQREHSCQANLRVRGLLAPLASRARRCSDDGDDSEETPWRSRQTRAGAPLAGTARLAPLSWHCSRLVSVDGILSGNKAAIPPRGQ